MASKGRNQRLVATQGKPGKFPCLLNLPLGGEQDGKGGDGTHLPNGHIKHASTLEQFSLKTTGDWQKDTYTTKPLRNKHRVRWEGKRSNHVGGSTEEPVD